MHVISLKVCKNCQSDQDVAVIYTPAIHCYCADCLKLYRIDLFIGASMHIAHQRLDMFAVINELMSIHAYMNPLFYLNNIKICLSIMDNPDINAGDQWVLPVLIETHAYYLRACIIASMCGLRDIFEINEMTAYLVPLAITEMLSLDIIKIMPRVYLEAIETYDTDGIVTKMVISNVPMTADMERWLYKRCNLADIILLDNIYRTRLLMIWIDLIREHGDGVNMGSVDEYFYQLAESIDWREIVALGMAKDIILQHKWYLIKAEVDWVINILTPLELRVLKLTYMNNNIELNPVEQKINMLVC